MKLTAFKKLLNDMQGLSAQECVQAKKVLHGRQRFKCKACSKTFSALTCTPLARLRLSEKHIDNAQCMVQGMSIRNTALQIGVHTATAFRWRHRFLKKPQTIQPALLSGLVEADETFFPESFKGQRRFLGI